MASPKTLALRNKVPEPARDKDGEVIAKPEPRVGKWWNRKTSRKNPAKHSHAKHMQPNTKHKGRVTKIEVDDSDSV